MPLEILSKPALDLLNRACQFKSDMEGSSAGGFLSNEIHHLMIWLGEHLRSELQREEWEQPFVQSDERGLFLYIYSRNWQLRAGDRIAFCFHWSYQFNDPPYVQIQLPVAEVLPLRNDLLNRIGPRLKRLGFTNYYEKGDIDPCFPLWKTIDLQKFHGEVGFDLDSFVSEIIEDFRLLLEIAPLIDDIFLSLPAPAHPSERKLKRIAFLDTESTGSGKARRLSEFAIVSVAYDQEGDAVVGILDEYCMSAGETLDEWAVRGLLEKADFIIAHNESADRPLLASSLPGTEKMNWLCSFRGMDWKQLLGVNSGSLENLIIAVGHRSSQDHSAEADARDLRRLLSHRHEGRTFLGRLLPES